MALRVVGAGLGRTGTWSLKIALERLLDAPCYHMREVFGHDEHVPVWHAAARGDLPDWQAFLSDYAAAVDWPAASFWPELAAAFPDAIVLLSLRDPEDWWDSVQATIITPLRHAFSGADGPLQAWSGMIRDLFTSRFTNALDDKAACLRAFEEHNAHVRSSVPADRLVEWRAGDGWEPLCGGLDLSVPDEPFPWVNKREDWGSGR